MRELRIWSTTQLGFLRAESVDVIGEKSLRMEVVDMGTCVLE